VPTIVRQTARPRAAHALRARSAARRPLPGAARPRSAEHTRPTPRRPERRTDRHRTQTRAHRAQGRTRPQRARRRVRTRHHGANDQPHALPTTYHRPTPPARRASWKSRARRARTGRAPPTRPIPRPAAAAACVRRLPQPQRRARVSDLRRHRARARRFARAGPAQVAVPAVRDRLRAGPGGRRVRAHVRAQRRLPARHRRRRGDFRDRSILTRTSRALKLWLCLRVFGLVAFREAVAHWIALVEHAEAALRAPGLAGRSSRQPNRRSSASARAMTRRRPRAPDDGARWLRRPGHDVSGREHGALGVRDQCADHVRGRRAHDRAHGGARFFS
jgi:hypothetical protein